MPKNTSKKVQKKAENKREVKELIDDIEEDVDFDFESGSDEDDSTSESEDENAEAMSSKLDRDWFRTLAALKTNDPKIHDKNAKFYESSSSEDEDSDKRKKVKKSKKDKPYLLKDYQHEVLMKKGGIIDEEEETQSTSFHHDTKSESEIKNSLKTAFINSEDEESSSDDFLKKRVKTVDQEQEEDAEYINWLKGQKHSLDNDKHVKKDLKPLKKLWNQPDLDDNEKFLADFFLNKRYISKEQEASRLPTYEEIVSEERQDYSKFMGKFKHRFEEPGGRTIPSYPRKIEDSVRRKDTRRADKNRDVRERKIKHKEEKRKEIEKVKANKRKEILAKIKKIQEVTGNEKVGFTDEDLEGDFDPEKHDQMMKERFNDDYYNDENDEESKPVFHDDEDDDLNANNEEWNENGYNEDENNEDENNEDENNDESNFNMDADYDPSQDLRSGKKRKKSKFTEAVKKKKPVFDPTEKSFPEYFDEYYNLDFEDVIGDLPCRYKYRKTQPNDFGLTIEEILSAPDKELNKWATAQNVVRYLTEEEERIEKIKYKKRGKSVMKKVNLMPTLRDSLDPEALAEAEAKVKQKTDEKQKRKDMKSQPTSKRAKLRQLHKKFKKDNQSGEKKMSNVQKSAKVSDSRVKAYGYDPRKLNYLHTDNYRKESS